MDTADIVNSATLWLRRGREAEAQGTEFGLSAALHCYEQARATVLGSSQPTALRLHALACMNCGNVLQRFADSGRQQAAISAYDEAIAGLTRLAVDAEPEVRNQLGAAWLNRGHALQQPGPIANPAEAVRSHREAIAVLATLPRDSALPYRANLTGAWINLADALLALQSDVHLVEARSAAEQALALAADEAERSALFAELSLMARRAQLMTLARLLVVRLQPELVGLTSDAIDEGLALARHWELAGVQPLRPFAVRLFRVGVGFYRRHQPHFLAELILETIGSDAPPAWQQDPDLTEIARQTIQATLRDLSEARVLVAGEVTTERLLETRRSLNDAAARLSPDLVMNVNPSSSASKFAGVRHSAALALLAVFCLGAVSATAQSNESSVMLEKFDVTAKREHRTSKGATNLPLTIKDTPQTISTIEQDVMRDFATTDVNEALRLGTGITVDAWETNRTSYSSRGFDIMLTQVDGLGMTNDWGLVVGQQDSYLFDRIELIRGANGLLTGVGNASGTINYVRKRPINYNRGEIIVRGGSHDLWRAALDYNQVLTESGTWAGRVVVAHEDKDSYLRGLQDRRTTVYGVVEGQVGTAGALTVGFSYADSLQRSPMWGSLTLMRADGTQLEFDSSASTSQDWARWDLKSANAFVEYVHTFSPDWEAKLTYNHRTGDEGVKLFYAYTFTGYLNNDNTGLVGWPYRSDSESKADIVDANVVGHFNAFGRRHELILGLALSKQDTYAETYNIVSAPSSTLPAFPYNGAVYAEPVWGDTYVSADGEQKLARVYAATRLSLTDRLKAIAGINAINLKRDGTSIYGGGVNLDDETTEKVSPYAGLTFDLTSNALVYASYSDIFAAQDQRDVNGRFLAPMKGVNAEVGAKAEWLDRRLLTTVAFFNAEQKGLATEAGFDPVAQQSYYEPKDVKSRGFELEVIGRIGANTNLSAGFTRMELTGPDGNDIYEWIPRTIFSLRADTRLPGLPKLKFGAGLRWQSDIFKIGSVRQDSYLLVNAFAAYELTKDATIRLNVDNITDEKYLRTVQFGAIYGATRQFSVALEYKL